jgi:hypothetical protein
VSALTEEEFRAVPSDVVIVKAVQTCYGLPSAWNVWTASGEYRHFKYRHGVASVWARAEDADYHVKESSVPYGDPLAGITTLEEFCAATGFTLDLREPYEPLPDPNEGINDDGYGPWAAATEDEPPIRAQVLREAESLICGDREQQYGHPRDNLQRIANYWNDYLLNIFPDAGDLLEPRDVALMMVLAKVAREAAGHKRDSAVDIAGYAALAAEVADAA